jgi:hypothetical protein
VVLATAGYDHTIRFWEATSGICYRTLQYPDSQVRHCATAAPAGAAPLSPLESQQQRERAPPVAAHPLAG